MNLYGFVGNAALDHFDAMGLEPEWGGGILDKIGSRGNCWRHACNDPMKPGDKEHSPYPPGWDPKRPHGKDPTGNSSCFQLIEGLIDSGAAERLPASGNCPSGYNKTVVQYADSIRNRDGDFQRDFHFVRERPITENNKNRWCDKPGIRPQEFYPKKPEPGKGYRECGTLCIQNGWDIDGYTP
jgi:hypothetical protein